LQARCAIIGGTVDNQFHRFAAESSVFV